MSQIPQLPQIPMLFSVPGNIPTSGDISGRDDDAGIQLSEPIEHEEEIRSEATEPTIDVKFREVEEGSAQFPQGGFVVYGRGSIPLNKELVNKGGVFMMGKVIGKNFAGKPRYAGFTGTFYPKDKYEEIKQYVLSVYPELKIEMIPSRGTVVKTGFKPQQRQQGQQGQQGYIQYTPKTEGQQEQRGQRPDYTQQRPRAERQIQKQTVTYIMDVPEQGMHFDVFTGDKKFGNVIERVASHNGVINEAYFKTGGSYKRLVIVNGAWQIHGDSSVHSIVFNA